MKRTLFSILFTITVLGLIAQNNWQDMLDSGTNRTRFGLRLSWNLSSPRTSRNNFIPTYHNGSGLSGGAFVNVPLFKNMYIEPGLGYYYNTMIISQNIRDDIELDYPLTREGSLRNSGILIPVTVGFRVDFTDDISVSLFTGPQLNLGVTLREHYNSPKSSHNLYNDGWKRVDVQWLFGLRFYYSDNWIAEITGGLGLTNLLDQERYPHQNFRRNSFSIGVGYLF